MINWLWRLQCCVNVQINFWGIAIPKRLAEVELLANSQSRKSQAKMSRKLACDTIMARPMQTQSHKSKGIMIRTCPAALPYQGPLISPTHQGKAWPVRLHTQHVREKSLRLLSNVSQQFPPFPFRNSNCANMLNRINWGKADNTERPSYGEVLLYEVSAHKHLHTPIAESEENAPRGLDPKARFYVLHKHAACIRSYPTKPRYGFPRRNA
jgi:hypothetical protein